MFSSARGSMRGTGGSNGEGVRRPRACCAGVQQGRCAPWEGEACHSSQARRPGAPRLACCHHRSPLFPLANPALESSLHQLSGWCVVQDSMAAEAAELANASFGEVMLHTVGRVYEAQADIFLG